MKVAVISDIHYGCRSDSLVFLDYTKKFLDTVFFPMLEERGIKDVIIGGDLVDRRKYINYNTAKRLMSDFIEPLNRYNVFVIPGNHDIYHKDNNGITAIDVFGNLGISKSWKIFNEPEECQIGDRKFLFVPWICPENQDRCLKAIDSSVADVCIGHLELQGFTMYPGLICSHGMPASQFQKFNLVLSGHFHSVSKQGNIRYVGSPIQITWNDYSDPRGFWILDTETLKMEFFPNPFEMFAKLVYDDSNKSMEDVLAWEYPKYQDAYVKVIVKKKTNPYWFDLFIEKLESYATDVKIVEESFEDVIEVETVDGYEDTITILKKYVENTKEIHIDKGKLQSFLVGLYNEAIQTEV